MMIMVYLDEKGFHGSKDFTTNFLLSSLDGRLRDAHIANTNIVDWVKKVFARIVKYKKK